MIHSRRRRRRKQTEHKIESNIPPKWNSATLDCENSLYRFCPRFSRKFKMRTATCLFNVKQRDTAARFRYAATPWRLLHLQFGCDHRQI